MIFLFLLALFASTTIAIPNGFIVLYGDVHKDVEFFTRTFPWIIDNIGGHLNVEYHLLGSGRYSVPQACALRNLPSNTFLQAEYLRCEAKGYPGEYCLCEAGIEPENFKQCVANGGYIAGTASERFSSYDINYSPIVDIGSSDVIFGVDDISFLKKICTIYSDNPPRGCIHYSNQLESFLEKKALAQFDRACLKEFPIDDDKPEAETTTEWPSFTTTSKPWVTPTTTPDWWLTTPPWWWSTTTTRRTDVPTTTPDWWSTTPPWWWTSTTTRPTDVPTTTPDWWSTTPPWWWTSTTTRPTDMPTTTPDWWSTTPPWWWSTTKTTPWWCNTQPSDSSTTSPPWSTTSPPWFTTSTPATRTTPQLSTTTPRPTQPTLWPTWWPTRTTARPTWPTLWPIRATPSNEEVTVAPIPE